MFLSKCTNKLKHSYLNNDRNHCSPIATLSEKMLKQIRTGLLQLKSKLGEFKNEISPADSAYVSRESAIDKMDLNGLSDALVESFVSSESKQLFFNSHDYSDGFTVMQMHRITEDFFLALLKCKAVQEYGQDYGESVVVDGLVSLVRRCCDGFIRMIDSSSDAVNGPADRDYPQLSEDEWSFERTEDALSPERLFVRQSVCRLGMGLVDELLDGNWIVKSLQAFQKHVTAIFAKRNRSMIVEHLDDLPLVKHGAVSVEGLLQLQKKFSKCDERRLPEIKRLQDILMRFMLLFQPIKANGEDINVYSVMLSRKGPGLVVLQYASAQQFFDQNEAMSFPSVSLKFDTMPRINFSPNGRCMIELGEFEVAGQDVAAAKKRLNAKIDLIKFVISKCRNVEDDEFFITKRIFHADTRMMTSASAERLPENESKR